MSRTIKLILATHPTLHLFESSPESFVWNTLIRAQARPLVPPTDSSTPTPALRIYSCMRLQCVAPDLHTFPFLLQSIASPSSLRAGMQVHAHIFRFGLDTDTFIQTSLINMYALCSNLSYACQVFDEILIPDLPSWNAMISAHVKSYSISHARQVFDKMPERNVISWSCMMNGYVRCGLYREVLALFREMQALEVKPNEFTMSSVLGACGHLGALEHGKWAHAYIDKCGMKIDIVLGTSLIDMYAKCGAIERAREVFFSLGDMKDVKAWSAMISGLAMHGDGRECFELFSKMQEQGVKPNGVTFLGVLCACAHVGLVNEGRDLFERMSREFGISPMIQHYGCLVDLYCRAGLVDKAWEMVNAMPMEPDVLVWGSLLNGSRMQGDLETCQFAIRKVIELEPMNSGAYVLLSNFYAKMRRWEDVRQVREVMAIKGIKKVPGCSMVEVDGVIYEFFAGDDSHPETEEIYSMLEEIMARLRKAGYVENTGEVLLDLDEEGKEVALSLHSEKLAIAFCFIKTCPRTPIRVIKNLRICGDCHVAINFISGLFDREIVVRDCNRFHHFRDGSCSCNDYW